MGFLGSLIRGENLAPAVDKVGPSFSTSIDPGTLYGFTSVDEAIKVLGTGGTVTRKVAIRVPAIKKSRDLICSGTGQLHLNLHAPGGAVVPWTLFEQPEETRAPVLTWTDVIDDMFFTKRARFRVTHFGYHGRPAHVELMRPGTYTPAKGGVWFNRTGKPAVWVPDSYIIEIESPNDAILDAGARAIRVLAHLELAAQNAVDGVPMTDYFTPSEPGVDPFEDDEEAQQFLDDWADARRKRATGFVPVALTYNSNTINPEQLQLAEARTFAIAEIARLTGIDAEELGVSTTSRTYFNAQDRRRHLLDFVFGPYRRAIEDRLSMPDVTPRGFVARFDTAEFARADDKTTADTDKVLIDAGVMTIPEVRARRGLPPLDVSTATPAKAAQEATA